jgi:hypothetical protein
LAGTGLGFGWDWVETGSRLGFTEMPDGKWQKPAKIAAFFRFFVLGKVDRNRSRTLYRSSWVRRRLGALARPRSPSLFTR